MIKLIGKNNCGLCSATKVQLDLKDIEYDYVLMEDLTNEEFEEYKNMAIEANNLNFPLIIKDNKSLSINEVVASHE